MFQKFLPQREKRWRPTNPNKFKRVWRIRCCVSGQLHQFPHRVFLPISLSTYPLKLVIKSHHIFSTDSALTISQRGNEAACGETRHKLKVEINQLNVNWKKKGIQVKPKELTAISQHKPLLQYLASLGARLAGQSLYSPCHIHTPHCCKCKELIWILW